MTPFQEDQRVIRELRAEIERLQSNEIAQRDGCLALIAAGENQHAEIERLRAENERLRELKTPASRELLNITKGCLDNAEAENERLRAALKPFAKKLRKINQAHLDAYDGDEDEAYVDEDEVYVRIGDLREASRALKEKP
jgi:hypothetical protein